MKRRRGRPWPAFVDLFSALFIAAFGCMILLQGKTEVEVQRAEIRNKVDEIKTSVQMVLEQKSPGEDIELRQEGNDIIFPLDINFRRDSDRLAREDVAFLRDVAQAIKETIDELPTVERPLVRVMIAGHTDSTQAYGIQDARQRYLLNWNLSSMRAASVLYEFKEAGLSPSIYSVRAIGYADSQPVCETEDCADKNRRTELRLSPDIAAIQRYVETRGK